MLDAQKNQIALAVNNAKTMSSRQIAIVVNSRHDSVKRTIERLAESGVISFTPMVETSHEGAGSRPVEVYAVNERDSYVVVAQLSPEFTANLVDYWQATKSQHPVQQFTIPSNLPEALRLAADLAEQKAVLEAKVQADAPKVQFHDQVTEAINCQTVEEVAKVLGTGKIRMFRWLRQEGFLMSDNNPYQSYLDRGYFRVIEAQYNDKKRGESHTYTKTLITGKGLAFIQKRFMQEAA